MIARQTIFTLPQNQPLIAIPVEENGKKVVRYFSEERSATTHAVTQAVLALAGAWSDLPFDDMIQTLDHIRHETKPPPQLRYEAFSLRYRSISRVFT